MLSVIWQLGQDLLECFFEGNMHTGLIKIKIIKYNFRNKNKEIFLNNSQRHFKIHCLIEKKWIIKLKSKHNQQFVFVTIFRTSIKINLLPHKKLTSINKCMRMHTSFHHRQYYVILKLISLWRPSLFYFYLTF